jgi:hypothetical protein
VFPANSWGSTLGRAVDVTNFKQISFWASVDGPSPFTVDMHLIPFEAGAGGINPTGTYANKGEVDYIDGVKAKQGWSVTDPAGVTSDMKQFHIALGSFEKGFGCNSPTDLAKAMGHLAPNCTGGQAEIDNGTAQATFLIGAFEWDVAYPADTIKCVDGTANCRAPADPSQYLNPGPVHIYLDDIVWSTDPIPATP